MLHNGVGLERMKNNWPYKPQSTQERHFYFYSIGKYVSACLAPAPYSSVPKEAGGCLVKDPINISEADYIT